MIKNVFIRVITKIINMTIMLDIVGEFCVHNEIYCLLGVYEMSSQAKKQLQNLSERVLERLLV